MSKRNAFEARRSARISRAARASLLVTMALLAGAIGLQARRAESRKPAATTAAARPAAASPAAASPAAAPFKPVGSVKQIMTTLIDPHADAVWESVGTIIDANGVQERRPRTDAEWASVAGSALALAEAGNLLMLDGRAPDRDAWLRMSRALVDAGAAAVKAAEAHDAEALLAAGESVTVACDTCHGLYWKAGTKYGAAEEASAAGVPVAARVSAGTWIAQADRR